MKRPGTWKVASFRGVDLRIHFSLLFLLLYVILVAAVQFPGVILQAEISPLEIGIGSWFAGTIFALGLFLSVVLHEFGHVIMAQSMGVPVKSITLMMLGGVSEMGQLPDKKFAELKVAVVGPLVSLGLAAVCELIRRNTGIPEVSLFAYWLGSANLVLAIFNLIPAFPLDGGRVLRSLIAAGSGGIQATRISVKISKGFAWFLGFLGLFSFNVLMVLIAFFIYSAAEAEFYMLLARSVLSGLKVKEVMFKVPSLSGQSTLNDIVPQMIQNRWSSVPIEGDRSRVSVLTLDDINKVPRNLWATTRAVDIAPPADRILDASEPIQQALVETLTSISHALPVQDQGKIVGLLRDRDVSELLQFRTIGKPDEIAFEERKKAA